MVIADRLACQTTGIVVHLAKSGGYFAKFVIKKNSRKDKDRQFATDFPQRSPSRKGCAACDTPPVQVDPFAPRLLIDYDAYCRLHGPMDFGVYMAHWYAVEALVEAAEITSRNIFELTPNNVRAILEQETVN